MAHFNASPPLAERLQGHFPQLYMLILDTLHTKMKIPNSTGAIGKCQPIPGTSATTKLEPSEFKP